MNNNFSYDYVGNYKFCLNIPPFTLKIKVSNFENNETIIIEEVLDNFEKLPKGIKEVLARSNSFKSYICNFSKDFYIHFAVQLFNKNEMVHYEFFCKKVDEVI